MMSDEVDKAVEETIAAEAKELEKVSRTGVDITRGNKGIRQYLDEIVKHSIYTDDEVLQNGKCLLKSQIARTGLQEMVDICIVVVDIFCFLDVDLFAGDSKGPTKAIQSLMSE